MTTFPITTRPQLRELWVSPHTNRVIRGAMACTRTPDRHILTITKKETLFLSAIEGSKRMRVRNLPWWLHRDLAVGLIRLGLATKELLDDMDRHTLLRERSLTAADIIAHGKVLQELGVPLTEQQLNALEAVRAAAGDET